MEGCLPLVEECNRLIVGDPAGKGRGANIPTSFSSSSDLLSALHFSQTHQKARDQGSLLVQSIQGSLRGHREGWRRLKNGSGGANGNDIANTRGKIIRHKGITGTHFRIVGREERGIWDFNNIGNILLLKLRGGFIST